MSEEAAIRHFNSVQLNLVTFVDVQKATAAGTLDGSVFMMDNNVNSKGRGTGNLETLCKPGQTLNWIIYAMNADKQPDGTWPPSVRINNIVFLEDGGDVSDIEVCDEFKIYGGPDKIRSKYTPVYYYWAGTVLDDLPGGVYKYRLVLDLDTSNPQQQLYLNHDAPSLRVISI